MLLCQARLCSIWSLLHPCIPPTSHWHYIVLALELPQLNLYKTKRDAVHQVANSPTCLPRYAPAAPGKLGGCPGLSAALG